MGQIARPRTHHGEGDDRRKLDKEGHAKLEALVPAIVVLVPRQPRPAGEEAAPRGRVQLEEGLEEAPELFDGLSAEELSAKDLKVALEAIGGGPHGRVRGGGGRIGARAAFEI